MWSLSPGFCKSFLLYYVLFFVQCNAGNTRLLSQNGDINESRIQQMELAIQNITTVVDELKRELSVKNIQIGNLTTIVNSLQRRVAFMAEVSGSYLNPAVGQHIVYDKVYFNDGNGYHSFHGTFIAPIGGLYEFSMGVTAKTGSNIWTHINMMRNGITIGYIPFDGLSTGYPWLKETESVLVHLDAGDEVWVQVTVASGGAEIATALYKTMHTYFSGYLIKEDL